MAGVMTDLMAGLTNPCSELDSRALNYFLESMWRGDSDGWGCGRDYECVTITLRLLGITDRESIEKIAARKTHELLSEPRVWAAVTELAEALLKYKVIKGSVVKGIVKRNLFSDLALFVGLDMQVRY